MCNKDNNIDYDKCNKIIYQSVMELSKMKYIPKGYVEGGVIATYKNSMGLTVNDSEYSYILEKVRSGLEYAFSSFAANVENIEEGT